MYYTLMYAVISFTSLYDFTLRSLNGGTIAFSNYQGKKILLVNMAVQSSTAALQLTQLQQFYATHQDSIVVIGIPSNSFGKTNVSVQQLQDTLTKYNVQFPVTDMMDVTGDIADPFFYWLTHKSDNGVLNSQIKKDFQKYLFNRQGQLTGFFSSVELPLGTNIGEAIKY